MSPKYLLVLVILRQTVTWQSQVILDKLVTWSRSRSELQSLAICTKHVDVTSLFGSISLVRSPYQPWWMYFWNFGVAFVLVVTSVRYKSFKLQLVTLTYIKLKLPRYIEHDPHIKLQLPRYIAHDPYIKLQLPRYIEQGSTLKLVSSMTNTSLWGLPK